MPVYNIWETAILSFCTSLPCLGSDSHGRGGGQLTAGFLVLLMAVGPLIVSARLLVGLFLRISLDGEETETRLFLVAADARLFAWPQDLE